MRKCKAAQEANSPGRQELWGQVGGEARVASPCRLPLECPGWRLGFILGSGMRSNLVSMKTSVPFG